MSNQVTLLPSGSGCVDMTLSYDNATHLLFCSHAVGKNGKRYYMRCHVLKIMPDGRLKVQVYGDRYWKNTGHVIRTRYVDSGRVIKIPRGVCDEQQAN